MPSPQPPSRPRTVAILPAYNLEKIIPEIVRRTLPFVDQVIVVADASRDGTAVAARAAGAFVPEPVMDRGKGRAVIRGIEASKAFKPEIVVLMDSDGQHLPEEMPGLIAPIAAGRAQAVVGSRMLGVLRTSTINKFGNLFLKTLSFCLTFRWMTDTESGYRAFRAEELYALKLSSIGYQIESELLLRAMHRGITIVEVPITVPFAVPGVTVWDGVKVAWYKIALSTRLRLGLEKG